MKKISIFAILEYGWILEGIIGVSEIRYKSPLLSCKISLQFSCFSSTIWNAILSLTGALYFLSCSNDIFFLFFYQFYVLSGIFKTLTYLWCYWNISCNSMTMSNSNLMWTSWHICCASAWLSPVKYICSNLWDFLGSGRKLRIKW